MGSKYQGEVTPLSTISIGASGSRIRAAPSMARSQGDRMYPALAWYVNSAQTAAMSAPESA